MNELSLGIVSGIFTTLFYTVYLWSVFKGETKPHIYTAFLYFILSMMPFFIVFKNGAGYGSVYFGISTVFWGIIFLLSFKYGFEGITKSDKFALVLAVLAGIVWYFTSNPLYALLLIILTDIFSSYPMIRKTYYHLETENRYVYLIEAIGVLASILALAQFNFINGAFLVYILLFDLLMFLIVFLRRRNN